MRRKIFNAILASLLFPLACIYAQSPDLKEIFLEAESYFLFEEYNEALPLYLRIHRADPDNDDINYKIGVCLLNDPYQKDRSIRYLEQASRNINPKYKQNSFKERTAPPEAFFYLGNAYLVNDNIDKAKENYLHFRDILDEKVYDVELVEEQIRICDRASYLKTMPVDYDYHNPGESINTRFADINPIVSGKGDRLVYVSKMQFYDATFFSEKIDGEWQPPRNIIPELGVDGDVYPTSLSWDGNTMIIYRNDDFIGNLYVSSYENGRWTALEKLGDNINTKYWESHGSLSKDGKTLYFTSNRKGGFGGLDIYKSEKQENGIWGLPINLGPMINSRYNEDTPFITENGKLLYFSSYGHYNMGGYDVFYSAVDENGAWGEPINLGFPINTTDDDLFFYPVNNGDNAYFSKFMDGGLGRHDIYFLDVYSENNPRLYLITGAIDSDTKGIGSSDSLVIYLIDRTTKDTIQIGQPDLANQTFELKAPQGDYDLLLRSITFNDLVKQIIIDELTEKEGIRIDKELVLETKPYEPKLLTGSDSRIGIEDTLITAQPGRKLKIRMDLEKGSTLFAAHSIDSITIASDTFNINRRRFVYEIVPEEGTNLVDLIMVEENGDRSITQLVIKAGKEEEIDTGDTIISDITDQQAVPGDPADKEKERNQLQKEIDQLKQDGSKELRELLKDIDPSTLGINNIEELIEYLERQGADRNQLEELKSIHKVNNNADELLRMMINNSERELQQYLRTLDLEKEGISSAAELLDHLRKAAENNGFNENDIIRTLKKINVTLTEADKALEDLISSSQGNLRAYLQSLDLAELEISTTKELLDLLNNKAGVEFETDLLLTAISDLVNDKPLDAFVDYLMKNSPKELSDFLRGLNLEKEGIQSINDLVSYLIKHADQLGFTEEEMKLLLIDLISKFATEPIPEADPETEKSWVSKGLKITGGLLFTGLLVFILIFLRRRKKDPEKE